jgi:hypothetical protein
MCDDMRLFPAVNLTATYRTTPTQAAQENGRFRRRVDTTHKSHTRLPNQKQQQLQVPQILSMHRHICERKRRARVSYCWFKRGETNKSCLSLAQ